MKAKIKMKMKIKADLNISVLWAISVIVKTGEIRFWDKIWEICSEWDKEGGEYNWFYCFCLNLLIY